MNRLSAQQLFFLFILSGMSLASQSEAQSNSAGQKKIHPQITEQLIKYFPALKNFSVLRSDTIPQIDNADTEQIKIEDPEVTNPLPVTQHLRGDKGTPLYTTKQDSTGSHTREEEQTERIKNIGLQLSLNSDRSLKERVTARKLPICINGKTVRKENIDGAGINEAQSLVDILVIPESARPLDTSETFGPQISIWSYNPEDPGFEVIQGQQWGATCVPFRLRVSKGFTIMQQGESALKNYERDPLGAGEDNDGTRLVQRLVREAAL